SRRLLGDAASGHCMIATRDPPRIVNSNIETSRFATAVESTMGPSVRPCAGGCGSLACRGSGGRCAAGIFWSAAPTRIAGLHDGADLPGDELGAAITELFALALPSGC